MNVKRFCLKQFYSEFVRRGPVANGVAWFIADSAKFSGNSFYPERGRTAHPTSSKGKSYPPAMAIRYFLPMVLAMKTEASRRVTKDLEPYVQLQLQMHEALFHTC